MFMCYWYFPIQQSITRLFSSLFNQLFDADGDKKVTLKEVEDTAQTVDPKLKGTSLFNDTRA